ncbi:pilus assembly protein PilZ [Pseudomonas plecoglossicida]|jgi:general secretion pathway protein C|nr:type II secretion protein C [Pseudomonas asiatica]AGA72019.1 type II secretion protein C [Pseudomonas putida HB3267]KPM61788.1 pilus assembly protein PilZ [Pseudomonas putida]PBJ96622.1 pilus assembly protein PilZ [Pseudomonas plecoglossicida]PJI74666.1 pilus assembly protein PilZ [Pseudomonas sp. MR 02]PLP86265.1 pilus assembly protein PilZ [Pseudomonas sp. FFUP_PS_41]QKK99732.1 pilus assembly protein PilZ [Pseudomonas sp. 13159349]TXI04469.1 MAG: pilus assembly protein PilZ [Pseudomonas
MLASRLLTGAGLTLVGWLAAQCVLQLGRQPQPATAPAAPDKPLPGLMVGHWQVPVNDGAIAITRLPLQYLGGLKAQPLASSVVVLRYGEQVRTLARGQRLAPGIVLQDIDSDGLIFNNQGRRERLPWPPRPAVTGFKRQG